LSDKDKADPLPRPTKAKSASGAPDLGKALRTVYDETLREEVPSDFMDLLGKLS
jgi:hypothetical protein